MKALNPKLRVNEFFDRLPRAKQRALFLDYDGTLAPFKTNPGEALPYRGVRELISRIMERSETRLVIVTGRWTRDLIPLLKCLKRLLAHVNYMFCFDNRNRLSEVLIVGRSEPYAPPVLRKPPQRRDIPRVRRSFNRPRL